MNNAFNINFDNYLFHPSSLGNIMTSGRTKNEPLGETCKSQLLACYIEERYGRKKKVENKFIEKGLAVEEDSITLYSRVTKRFHKKNTEQIKNDFFIGTPDLFDGDSIMQAKTIIDIKSSWDIHTFFKVMIEPINKMYYWQGQAYMDLTGADIFKLVYCLVNTPDPIINDEKRKLIWKMGVTTDEHPDAIEAMKAIEKEMTFDDIPLNERYIELTIYRNDDDIDQAKEKIKLCRSFLNELNTEKLLVK